MTGSYSSLAELRPFLLHLSPSQINFEVPPGTAATEDLRAPYSGLDEPNWQYLVDASVTAVCFSSFQCDVNPGGVTVKTVALGLH